MRRYTSSDLSNLQLGSREHETERPDWLTPETLAYLRDVEYRFHVRAFGEEMARVNFLPLEQRRQYLYDIMDHARRKGVKSDERARGVTS